MFRVSVVMPVHNAEQFICKSIDSILNQSYSDIELILVDDYGTDESMELVKRTYVDSRIKNIKNDKNYGIAYSRNRGIEAATGEYIAFMDDDDVAPLNRLELEMGFLQNHPEIDAVGGRYCSIDEKGNAISYSDDTLQNPNYIKACLMFYDPLGNGTMLFRRDTVIKNNIRFKDNCCGMEDYLFWTDFSQVGSISNLKEVMLYWRNIDGNETSRFINERKKERTKKFAEIQKYAIRKNGFDLTEENENFLTTMLPEGRFEKMVSRSDTEKLYEILKDIVCQAHDKHMDNYNEVRTACRKQFFRRLEYSEMWDL